MEVTLMKIIESGQLEKLKTKYESNSNCNPNIINSDVSLSYQKLFLLFIIMSGGMAFAMVVLIYEILNNFCNPIVIKNIMEMKTSEMKSKEISTQT